jgi:hypothetical protein
LKAISETYLKHKEKRLAFLLAPNYDALGVKVRKGYLSDEAENAFPFDERAPCPG